MKKRKEIIGDCTLYLGDCLEIMPLLDKVDAVVTDPPYGINAGTGIGKITKEGSDFTHKTQWDSDIPCDKIFETMINISDKQIIWGGNYFNLPPTPCYLIWDKIQPENFTLAMAEVAWTNIKKPMKIFRLKSMSINGGAAKHHPTQKPLSLMKWCIGYVPDCETILDPFMGSGTTGVACAKLGRKFIGIELDEDYFNIACERIRKAYEQPDLFIATPKNLLQLDLLLDKK